MLEIENFKLKEALPASYDAENIPNQEKALDYSLNSYNYPQNRKLSNYNSYKTQKMIVNNDDKNKVLLNNSRCSFDSQNINQKFHTINDTNNVRDNYIHRGLYNNNINISNENNKSILRNGNRSLTRTSNENATRHSKSPSKSKVDFFDETMACGDKKFEEILRKYSGGRKMAQRVFMNYSKQKGEYFDPTLQKGGNSVLEEKDLKNSLKRSASKRRLNNYSMSAVGKNIIF